MRMPVLIMAGGTGGHVYPALAVARALLAQDIPVVWLGTKRGLEARIVVAAGIPMEWLAIGGLRRKGFVTSLLLPWRLTRACWQAWRIIRRIQPLLVIGMGGFVAGPGGLVCKLLRKPLLIHEQNAIAGLTNRWLARIADTVLTGFPNTFPANRQAHYVGNPVRAEITTLATPAQRYATRQGKLQLLIVGGSLGAQFLNTLLPNTLAQMTEPQRPVIRHQCGSNNLAATQQAYQQHGLTAEVSEFIEDMAAAYAWADLVICRAGAMTIAELAAAGIPAILVPYPHAVDDHQTANAAYLAESGAARLLQQTDLTAALLMQQLIELSDRSRLLAMAEQARALAKPDATATVVEYCLATAGGSA